MAIAQLQQPKMSEELRKEFMDAGKKLNLPPTIMNNTDLVNFVGNLKKELK